MRDVTRAKISSLCGAIWRTILNFYALQGVWVNCYRIHQKSLNFIYPFKFYSNFTNKNVSWLHFSWATPYTCRGCSCDSLGLKVASQTVCRNLGVLKLQPLLLRIRNRHCVLHCTGLIACRGRRRRNAWKRIAIEQSATRGWDVEDLAVDLLNWEINRVCRLADPPSVIR